MARKKRITETQLPPTEQQKKPVMYQDAFQEKAGKQIDQVSKQFEGKGRTVLYALGGLVVLAVLVGIIYTWNKRSNNAAQAALGKAIETSQAPVINTPLPAGFTEKVFKTEKERAEASINEFQAVANNYGGAVKEKALYFAAVNRLTLDRAAGEQELENLSKNGGEVGTLSKFALAQAKQGDGKLDEAAALYSDLAQSSDPIVSKDTINFDLASVYEKQGKKPEAADLYFKIADTASKAKDLDGKPAQMSQTARDAKDKLQDLDPTKAAQIKDAAPDLSDE